MSSREQHINPTPMKRHVRQIVWLLLAVSVVLASLSYLQAQALGAVRAYVHGESQWAKGQKDAVLQLYRYISDPADATYAAFEHALRVNLSYRQGRLALQQPEPDWTTARAGFLAAGSHPDDVDNMIRMFLWFGEVRYMKQAIAIWVEGDQHIERLQALAQSLRVDRPPAGSAALAGYLSELERLHRKLHELELAFSRELNAGARWISATVVALNFVVLLVMILLAGGISRQVIGEIGQTESRLRESESRFRALYDSDLIGIISWGMNGEMYDANDAFLKLLGYSRAELPQLNWLQMTPPESLSDDERALQQVSERGYCDPFAKYFLHKDGHSVAVLVGGALITNRQNQGMAFVLDRSKERQMEDQLRQAATVLDASLDGVLIADRGRRILTVNDAYCRMTGLARDALVGSSVHFGRAQQADETAQIEAGLATNGYWQGDTLIHVASGEYLPVRVSLSAVHDDAGAVLHYVAVFTDISVRQALERELKNLAHFDPLTGLANRSLFSDRLDTALSRAQRNRRLCALLFIDLDKFKPVNDQFGHAVGDQLLQQVAQRLKTSVRESDTIGRLGGDEFVAIIEGVEREDAVIHIAEKMIALLDDPFEVGEHILRVGCSIGISLYPQHGDTGGTLMRAADIAMYAAKAAPDRQYYVFTSPN